MKSPLLWILLFALGLGVRARADSLEAPASAGHFTGTVTGKVNWIGPDGYFLMLWVATATSDDGDSAPYAEFARLPQGLKIGHAWDSPTTPNPAQNAFIKSLQPGQALTLRLRPGYGGQGVRLAEVPDLAATPAPVPPPVSAPALGAAAPMPAPTGPLRLLCIGDSITQGSSLTSSYRPYLWKHLNEAGWSADFIGTLASGRDGQPVLVTPDIPADWDNDHESRWGWRTAQHLADGQLATTLPHLKPDLALVHLGTNELFLNQPPAQALADLRRIIGLLRKSNPRVAILLAKIIPTQNPAHAPWCEAHRTGCRTLAAELATSESPVVAVNVHAEIHMGLDYHDGAHPNASGARKMAAAWWTALQALPHLRR